MDLFRTTQSNSPCKPRLILYVEIHGIELFIILSILHKFSQKNIFLQLIVIDDDNVMLPLEKGMNKIYFPTNLFSKEGVGLLPLELSKISTRGLKWDTRSWETEFGKNASTSNIYLDDEVCVFVEDGSIILTTEIDIDKINFL